MFTGIIEEVGKIKRMNQVSESAMEITIIAKEVLQDVRIGDSISVNGICLTVTSCADHSFQVDVMPETVKATSLRTVKEGSIVNLERALLPTERLGGHFVTGHVDEMGTIVKKTPAENAVYYDIQVTKDIIPYFVEKGSVAVDGISLTVFGVHKSDCTITISIIPHTLKVTNLGGKDVDDPVNIECDMVAKHVHQYMDSIQYDRGEKNV